MTQQAGWGFWVIFAMAMMFMGPMMRTMFGKESRGEFGGQSNGKKRRLKGSDVARLEEAIGERDQVIEDLQHRLSEMESRLDFTERLLSERSQVER